MAAVAGVVEPWAATSGLAAQGVLSQFTYDNLRVSGLQVDVGSLAARDLRGALVGGVRLDAGYLAPHVRVLLGLSFSRSDFDQRALARFNRQLLALVSDPESNATIDVGRIRLADLQFGQRTRLHQFLDRHFGLLGTLAGGSLGCGGRLCGG